MGSKDRGFFSSASRQGTPQQQLDQRRESRGLDDIAYFTALGLIMDVGEDCPNYDQAMHAAHRTVRLMIAKRYRLPQDFLARNQANPDAYRNESISFKLGYEVADEILNPRNR